jgi:hypothetical protein
VNIERGIINTVLKQDVSLSDEIKVLAEGKVGQGIIYQ